MNSKYRNFLFFSFFIMGLAAESHAQNGGCSSVITLPDGRFIYKNAAPLRSGGIGTPLIGYRVEPTLIMNSGAFSSRGSTRITDSAGNFLGSCPWASAEGHSGGRFRCTMNTRNLRRAAIKNTRSPAIFIRYKGTACAKIPDAGRCYGSVKGTCNQTLS
jgi:hypothetical protein